MLLKIWYPVKIVFEPSDEYALVELRVDVTLNFCRSHGTAIVTFKFPFTTIQAWPSLISNVLVDTRVLGGEIRYICKLSTVAATNDAKVMSSLKVTY